MERISPFRSVTGFFTKLMGTSDREDPAQTASADGFTPAAVTDGTLMRPAQAVRQSGASLPASGTGCDTAASMVPPPLSAPIADNLKTMAGALLGSEPAASARPAGSSGTPAAQGKRSVPHGVMKKSDEELMREKFPQATPLSGCVSRTFDDVPVPFRIGIASALDYREYDPDGDYNEPDAAGDYQKLLDRSKDGADFMGLARSYAHTKVILMRTNQIRELDNAFEFLAGPLRDRPEDFNTYIQLLKGGQPAENAAAIFTSLPQPVQPADYQKAAQLVMPHKNWADSTVSLAVKDFPGLTLDSRVALMGSLDSHTSHLAVDGYEFQDQAYQRITGRFTGEGDKAPQALMMKEILDNTKSTRSLDSMEKAAELVSTRFQDRPDEHGILVSLLKDGVELDRALKAHSILTADEPKDDLYLKKTAFENIYSGIYKSNNNYVEQAMTDFGVASLCREPGESLVASADRLAGINRALGKAPFNDKTGMKKVARQSRELLVWAEREHRKGTFGDCTLNDAVAKVMKQTAGAESADRMREMALKDQGMADIDSSVLKLDDMIYIGGIKLNIRAE